VLEVVLNNNSVFSVHSVVSFDFHHEPTSRSAATNLTRRNKG